MLMVMEQPLKNLSCLWTNLVILICLSRFPNSPILVMVMLLLRANWIDSSFLIKLVDGYTTKFKVFYFTLSLITFRSDHSFFERPFLPLSAIQIFQHSVSK